jgi:hypothetical protein
VRTMVSDQCWKDRRSPADLTHSQLLLRRLVKGSNRASVASRIGDLTLQTGNMLLQCLDASVAAALLVLVGVKLELQGVVLSLQG